MIPAISFQSAWNTTSLMAFITLKNRKIETEIWIVPFSSSLPCGFIDRTVMGRAGSKKLRES